MKPKSDSAMQRLVFAFPGKLDTPTGGYGYDRRVIEGLRDLGWQVELLPLGDGFPHPTPAALAAAAGRLREIAAGTLVVIDGLAFGVMAEAAEASADQLSLVALVHHPLCLENGLGGDLAETLSDGERKALTFARHIIVTSAATSTQVQELFGVPREKISVVLPGNDRPGPVMPAISGKLRLLSVGTVVKRKGYDLLFDALVGLLAQDWHLDIVGGLEADPGYHKSLLEQIEDLGLADRVTFHGAVSSEALTGFYRKAHVFVLASRYEGYGMAYTEALTYGLPVIGSGEGAVRDTLPEGAAVYCGTEDIRLLQDALRLLISDQARRLEMAEAARAAALALPTWQGTACRFAGILDEVRK